MEELERARKETEERREGTVKRREERKKEIEERRRKIREMRGEKRAEVFLREMEGDIGGLMGEEGPQGSGPGKETSNEDSKETKEENRTVG